MALSACGPYKPMTPADKGRIVFVTNCVACHNPNPILAGPKGPPIAGSPHELVYDRVLSVKYPPGYKPKRTTHNMKPLPQLKTRIDDLVAFLAEAAKTPPTAKQVAANEAAAKLAEAADKKAAAKH